MTHPRVTIGDVAAQAGVSIATVSKVINRRYGVAAGTLARVQAVIDELGYESSIVAQSLRSHRTNVIGIVVADIEPFSAELLKGAARAIRGTGYELVVYSGGGLARDQAGWERRYLSRVSGTLTDGTVLVTPTVVDVVSSAPVVAVDPHTGPSNLPTVASDNLAGAVTATRYLLDLGHRRIGFLGGRPDLESARLREQGFRQALAAAGIALDPELLRVGGYEVESAEEPARQLLELAEPPTAIFAANDMTAIQVMRVASSLGMSVPGHLSVMGFDNIPESATVAPGLTTIEQPIQDMGAEAVGMLIGLIDRTDPAPLQRTLPTSLVVRQSCRTIGP
ncbi:MAG TPA: LacI family DNA-binding transcriptional regulator [Candidatus Dormibacteraeota bacterium]|nr:LacI family DNA-binding transcriptional regulator [Candidatus Dormibacteraeota bacterium]